MKAVLISINPLWCELIGNGEKTIEVRKNRPKLKTPFKVFIYSVKFLVNVGLKNLPNELGPKFIPVL